MAVKRHGAPIYLNLFITLDDNAIIVSGLRARALVADASHRPSHYSGIVSARNDLTSMTRRVADSDYATQSIPLFITHMKDEQQSGASLMQWRKLRSSTPVPSRPRHPAHKSQRQQW